MAQMRASRAVRSAIPAPDAAPSLAAAATSSMASPIRVSRSSVEHTLETIGQRDHDRDGFRPLRTAAPHTHAGSRGVSVRPAAPPPYTAGLLPIHPHPAARTSPPRRGFSKPSFAVSGTAPAGRLGRRPSEPRDLWWPIPLWTTLPRMWTARPLKVFSTHRPWKASVQAAGAADANHRALSPLVSSACAQRNRRVCTEFQQACAHRDWTPRACRHKTVVATYYN